MYGIVCYRLLILFAVLVVTQKRVKRWSRNKHQESLIGSTLLQEPIVQLVCVYNNSDCWLLSRYEALSNKRPLFPCQCFSTHMVCDTSFFFRVYWSHYSAILSWNRELAPYLCLQRHHHHQREPLFTTQYLLRSQATATSNEVWIPSLHKEEAVAKSVDALAGSPADRFRRVPLTRIGS